ncbi:MAG: radical SAM protein [Elusimicrobia bacterium]|nr:radical SAM protein [Elusimicrobiota bacterium]
MNETAVKPRIALLQAPVWGVYDPPFSLSLLSGCLKAGGCDVRSFDMNIDLYNSRQKKYDNAWAIEQSMLWSNAEFVERFFSDNAKFIDGYIADILGFRPDIIGLSVNSASRAASLKLAGLIRKKRSRAKIVFGGHMFMMTQDEETKSLLDTGSVDVLVCGEGERTFPELVKLLAAGADISVCGGIMYKDSGGRLVSTPGREPVKDLDSLPFMDFADMPLSKYENPGWLGKHLTFQASRGCPWKCAFCGATNYWKKFRCMSGRRIYEEIRFHLRNAPEIEHVEFMDLLFNWDMEALEEFCDMMIADPPGKELRWHANAVIRPQMDASILGKMKKAGCLRLTYGIESGSQKILDLMRKKYKVKDAGMVLKATHEAGILIKANFMFGFPGETEEDFQMTLALLKENAGYIDTAYPSFSFCVVEANSYLGRNMEEFGIVPNPDDNLYWESKDGTNTYPERLRRWEVFSKYAASQGVDIGLGLNTSVDHHKWLNLGYYYRSRNDIGRAAECFERYLALDPDNKAVSDELNRIKK